MENGPGKSNKKDIKDRSAKTGCIDFLFKAVDIHGVLLHHL